MTRLPVIAMVLAISACEHGETPPPGCGNRIVDFGEQCDDGNEVADDGCDQCVANNCGNSRLDDFEDCDDGNELDGDGCSSLCTFESSQGGLTLLWSVHNFAFTESGCPVDFPIIQFVGDGQVGSVTETFDCSSQNAFLVVPRDLYTAQLSVQALDGTVLAVSVPSRLDLRVFDTSLSADLFTDAGVFEARWQLIGAQTGNVVNCMQANVATIEVASTELGINSVFSCGDSRGFSQPLPVGSYSVSLTAKGPQQQLVSTSSAIAAEITVPDGLGSIGTISLTIPGL